MRNLNIDRLLRGLALLVFSAWTFFIPSKAPPADAPKKEPPIQPGAADNVCRVAVGDEADKQSEKPVLFIGCGGGF